MERTLWILSKFSFRVTVILLCIVDYYACTTLIKPEALTAIFFHYKWLIILLCIVFLAATIFCGIKGGMLGYKYVELGRSRRWHYRATGYEQKDDRLRNTLYWAGKFACFPIILAQIFILAFALTYNL